MKINKKDSKIINKKMQPIIEKFGGMLYEKLKQEKIKADAFGIRIDLFIKKRYNWFGCGFGKSKYWLKKINRKIKSGSSFIGIIKNCLLKIFK